jgi:acyl-CoA synthetase (AMP-forming)/AMP-acid ligase II
MHLGVAFSRLLSWHGDRIAIVDRSGEWSYRRFLGRVARFGQAMHGLGLSRGDRVGLLLPDIREYIEADYGTMAAGLVRVPMDPRATRTEIGALLRHAGVRALVVHADLAAVAEGLRAEVETLDHIVAVGGAMFGAMAGAADYETLLERAAGRFVTAGDADDLASLNFSGGTTGSPKAIMLKHRNLFAVAQNSIAGFDARPEAVFLNVRPLWPVAQVIMLTYLMAGARIVLGGRFDAERFPELVARTGTTRTSLVPTQLVRCLDHLRVGDPRLAMLESVHVGGSRISPPVFERALELFGPRIGVLYGLTEAPITCYLRAERLAGEVRTTTRLMESVGRPLFGYEVRLDGVDPSIPGPAAGEVLIRGANVMAGYWQNPPASAAALVDGWLHTGDIGQFDEHGDLSIVGRIKDVIRSGSTSIVPKEVEDAIALHPAVQEVAVIGVPDVEWGEAVTAFVVLKPGSSAGADDIIEHCRQHLAAHKKPKSVHFRDALPRSHYGKVPRVELLAGIAAATP